MALGKYKMLVASTFLSVVSPNANTPSPEQEDFSNNGQSMSTAMPTKIDTERVLDMYRETLNNAYDEALSPLYETKDELSQKLEMATTEEEKNDIQQNINSIDEILHNFKSDIETSVSNFERELALADPSSNASLVEAMDNAGDGVVLGSEHGNFIMNKFTNKNSITKTTTEITEAFGINSQGELWQCADFSIESPKQNIDGASLENGLKGDHFKIAFPKENCINITIPDPSEIEENNESPTFEI